MIAYTPIYDTTNNGLYFIDLSSGSPSAVMQGSLPGQDASPLASYPPYQAGWSLDGKTFAYVVEPQSTTEPSLLLLSTATLPPSTPAPVADTRKIVGFEWSPDSRNLLVRYTATFSDGTTGAFNYGRVTDEAVQPLDSVTRTAFGATWR